MLMIWKDYSELRSKNLAKAAKQKHIIDQWTLRNVIPPLGEMFQKLWYRIVKRGSSAPNGQTGCERANSTYNLFKTKLSVRMELPMIRARLRIKVNGPPQSKFKPASIPKLWLTQGHQYAETITQKKLVIDRIRSKADTKYISKIFD